MLTSSTTTIGVFDNRQQAEKAITDLKDVGFSDKHLGIASRDFAQQFESLDVEAQHTAEAGAIKGAAIGGGLGTAVGLIGGLLVPGIFPLVAGQALMTALIGGAAGAAGGAFAGPFVALGFSEGESKKHNELINEGKTVVVVYAPNRLKEAAQILVENGAYDESMSTGP